MVLPLVCFIPVCNPSCVILCSAPNTLSPSMTHDSSAQVHVSPDPPEVQLDGSPGHRLRLSPWLPGSSQEEQLQGGERGQECLLKVKIVEVS